MLKLIAYCVELLIHFTSLLVVLLLTELTYKDVTLEFKLFDSFHLADLSVHEIESPRWGTCVTPEKPSPPKG